MLRRWVAGALALLIVALAGLSGAAAAAFRASIWSPSPTSTTAATSVDAGALREVQSPSAGGTLLATSTTSTAGLSTALTVGEAGAVGSWAMSVAVLRCCVAAEGGSMAIRPPLSIGSKQFGTKWGRHATDYGLDPASGSARSWFQGRLRDVHLNPDEVRRGAWRGGGENYFFFRQGDDLLITQPDGTFVTMFPGASTNGWFKSAEVFPH